LYNSYTNEYLPKQWKRWDGKLRGTKAEMLCQPVAILMILKHYV